MKVLVVEDSPSDCELIVAELRRAGYTVDWRRAEGRHDLEEALEWGPNIVLVDHNLPQLDSLQALEVVRQSGVQAPLIIVSGQMEDDVGLVALRQGAADYLFKDSLARLPAAVEKALQRDRLGTPLIGSELDALITMDAAGDVVHWNDVAERLFGWSATEAGGRSLFTLVLPQRFQEAQRHAVSELRRTGGGARRLEVMARHRTGMEFPAELSLSVGAAASAMVIARVRDLTEQKEAEMRRVHDVEARFGLEAAIRRELLAQVLQAQEEERGRVARDLHDQIGQTLTSLRLALSAAEQSAKIGAGGDSLANQLADLRNQVGESIAEVRRIARDLRPSVLDELGLEAALRRHIADWSERTAIAATLHIDNLAADVHSDVRTAVYRIVQEALNNVAKHSQASAVSVFLRADAWNLRVLIEDDGVGFEPATAEDPLIGRGMGLRSMAERAQLLGGKFWVEAAPGVGTTVALELPL